MCSKLLWSIKSLVTIILKFDPFLHLRLYLTYSYPLSTNKKYRNLNLDSSGHLVACVMACYNLSIRNTYNMDVFFFIPLLNWHQAPCVTYKIVGYMRATLTPPKRTTLYQHIKTIKINKKCIVPNIRNQNNTMICNNNILTCFAFLSDFLLFIRWCVIIV